MDEQTCSRKLLLVKQMAEICQLIEALFCAIKGEIIALYES